MAEFSGQPGLSCGGERLGGLCLLQEVSMAEAAGVSSVQAEASLASGDIIGIYLLYLLKIPSPHSIPTDSSSLCLQHLLSNL